jgi:curved DNA-binding protein CbpA
MPEQGADRVDNAYAILGVTPLADAAEILAAYRSLARRHHPDLAGEAETARMSRINAAFDILRDSRRRLEYDISVGLSGVAAAREKRDWETAVRRRPRAATSEPARPVTRHHERDGTGGAGPPPGRASGSVLSFGRHVGWSIGEIARVDPGYLEWLEDRREGRPYLDEIDRTLVRTGYRSEPKRGPASWAPPPKKRRFSRA